MKQKVRSVLSILTAMALILGVGSLSAAGEGLTKEDVAAVTEQAFVAKDAIPQNIRSLVGDQMADSENARLCLSHKDENGQVVEDALSVLRVEDPQEGTGTVQLFSVPVKYEDDAGVIQLIDTSMKPVNSLLKQQYAYRNGANRFTVEYGRTAGTGLNMDDVYTMAVKDAAANQLSAIPATSEDGHGKLTYPNAFGVGTKVEYINTEGGVKENIILERNVGKHTFAFAFRSATHHPVLAQDGSTIDIVENAHPDKVAFRMLSLFAYDSYRPSEEEQNREPVEGAFRHFNEDCRYALTAEADGSYTITVVVPEAYLNHPEVVYPVAIDPSVTIPNSSSDVTDMFTDAATPSTPYNRDYLRFGCSNGKFKFSYIRFEKFLTAVPRYAAVANANITVSFRPGQTTGFTGSLCRVTENWSNTTKNTWNTQPWSDWDETKRATSGLIKNNDGTIKEYSFDVAEMAYKWRNSVYSEGYYGVCLTYTQHNYEDYNSVVSSEGEAARAPKMIVGYTYDEPIYNGNLYFIRNINSNKYLDVYKSQANVIQYPYKGGMNQVWKAIYDSANGDYSFVPMFNQNLRLDVSGGLDENETNMQVWENNGTNSQKFKLIRSNNGYLIKPKMSYKRILEVYYASTADEANVQIWLNQGAKHQEWAFELAETPDYSRFLSSTPIDPIRKQSQEASDAEYNKWPATSISNYYQKSDFVRNTDLTKFRLICDGMIASGPFVNAPNAALLMSHYLDNTGEKQTINLSYMHRQDSVALQNRNEDLNIVLASAEKLLENTSGSIHFISRKENQHQEELGTFDWRHTIGQYTTRLECNTFKTSNNTYNMIIRYYLLDFYDWARSEDNMGNLPISQRELWEMHHAGKAKQFLVEGVNLIQVEWEKYQRVNSGAKVVDIG